MTQREIIELLYQSFGVRDPLADAHIAMKEMDKKKLISLVLIAVNRIGTILKGDDCEDALACYPLFMPGSRYNFYFL